MWRKLRGVLLTLAVAAAVAVVCGAEAVYDWVVPLEYPEIELATDDYFVARSASSTEQEARWDLYTYEGNKVLVNLTDIEFYENWMIARRGDQAALFTYDNNAHCVIPFSSYVRIWLESEDYAVGLKAGEFVRPGSWVGEAERIDLKTGQVVATLGTQAEQGSVLPQRLKSSQTVFTECESPYGIHYTTDNTSGEGFAHRVVARNDDGQLLFDSTTSAGNVLVSHSSYGRLFHYFEGIGERAVNRVYSGRGRLLVEDDAVGLMGGQYLLTVGDRPRLLDHDGDLMIEVGYFTTFRANNATNHTGEALTESDDMVIVERDDKWGILRLHKRLPFPSDWAMEEAGAAKELGLVPEDAQYWWRDSCTRLEFCQMLSRAVKVMDPTGSKTSAGRTVTFSDCEDADVHAMASLGLVQGVGVGKFSPGKFLTRQEAATMLVRTAELLGLKSAEQPMTFADASSIASWARDSVAAVSSLVASNGKAVMQGTGGGNFSPTKAYTVEQAALSLLRLTQVS